MAENNGAKEAKPVLYEIVKPSYYSVTEQKYVPQKVYVREKREYSLYGMHGIHGYSEDVSPSITIDVLLTHIVQALEELGIEIAMEPAKPSTLNFNKRATSSSSEGPAK